MDNHYNMTSTSTQYPAPAHSGPVPNMSDPRVHEFASRPYPMYDTRGSLFEPNARNELIGRIHTETPLNTVFFSQSNIDKLQESIREQVFLMTESKHRIDRQSDDDLLLIMRSYYLMFGRNDDSKVAEELESLNRRVIGYASAKIFSELDFYMFYRKDIEDFAAPIARPTNTNVFGTRFGELKSFF